MSQHSHTADLTPPTIAAPAAPVRDSDRLGAIDAVRGFALLGIFLVNIQSFGEPFGEFIRLTPESTDWPTVACYYFVKTFCESKFYVTFSMLFGMGLVLQMHSVMRVGQSFVPLYLRRLAVLFLFGLIHAVLLWYGDILFIYSIAGAILLAMHRLSARTLLIIAASILTLSTLFATGLGALGAFGPPPAATAPAAASTPADPAPSSSANPSPESTALTPTPTAETTLTAPAADTTQALTPEPVPSPFRRLLKGFEDGSARDGPQSQVWLDAETAAYRDGPFLDAFLFRAMSWVFILIITLFGFGWSVVGMFCLGAGLLKAGIFAPHNLHWHKRFAAAFLLAGVPLAVLSSLALGWTDSGGNWAVALATLAQSIASPLFALGWLGLGTLLWNSSAAALLAPFQAVGRMALTNYLTQTIAATFVFNWWGLAHFGSFSRPERCALVLAIYAAQLILSPIWLRFFRFGPMEWLWRTLTYMKPQPMLRHR